MTRRGGSYHGAPWLAIALAFFVAFLRVKLAYGATVAILSDDATPAQSEATSRLRGELSALRLQVVLLRRPRVTEVGAPDPQLWLERTAADRGLDAAIEVVGDDTLQSADVWIFQRSPARAQVVRVLPAPNTPDRAGTLAIRAIEVLRSHNLEADLAAKAREREEDRPAAQPAQPAQGASREPEHEERLGVEVGAGILTGLDGVGPALLPVLRFDWRSHSAWIWHATVSGFGTRPTLRAADGSVRVAQGYGAIGPCYCPTSSQLLTPYFAVGAGASRTSLTGEAEPPANGHTVAQWSLLLDAAVGARARLPGRYYATLSGHLQLTQPRVAIVVVDQQVGTTGYPNFALNLMIGAWL